MLTHPFADVANTTLSDEDEEESEFSESLEYSDFFVDTNLTRMETENDTGQWMNITNAVDDDNSSLSLANPRCLFNATILNSYFKGENYTRIRV